MKRKVVYSVIAVIGLFAVATAIKAWLNSFEFRTIGQLAPTGSLSDSRPILPRPMQAGEASIN